MRGTIVAKYETDQDYYRFIITSLILKNNLSFSFADEFSYLMDSLLQNFSHSQLTDYRVNRNQVSRTANDFIAPTLQQTLFERMDNSPFSIAVDEGNVKGNIEYLAVTLRHYETDTALVTMAKLLALVEMQGSSTEEKLFKLLDDLLFSSRASEKRTFNFMGIATDKASNMISKRDAGLKNRLKEKHPHIYVVHDLFHALNLILQENI